MTLCPAPITSFPRPSRCIPRPSRHSRVGGNLDARSYGAPLAVRARRSVEPAAMSRPPARKSRSSRPPEMPGPPALGSSSGGMGVGVAVDVDVGTGVRVGVMVGGGVGVGVLVATMSYAPTPFSQRTHAIPAIPAVIPAPITSFPRPSSRHSRAHHHVIPAKAGIYRPVLTAYT